MPPCISIRRSIRRSASRPPLPVASKPIVAVSLGFAFGGVFPNRLHDCDVLRYQYLDRVTLDTSDIALASDHGRELLDYVTA